MLAQQRQERIMSVLVKDGALRVTQLVDTLGVSEMTVRRDIAELARLGLLKRIHGGAVPVAGSRSYAVSSDEVSDIQSTLVDRAISLIDHGDSIFFPGAELAAAFAGALMQLPFAQTLTVYTSSIYGAQAMFEIIEVERSFQRTPIRLVVIGGEPVDGNLVGPAALRSISNVNVTTAFFFPDGISRAAGLTSRNIRLAQICEVIGRRASQRVAVTESRRWGRDALITYCDLPDLNYLVTDKEPEGISSLDLKVMGVKLIASDKDLSNDSLTH